MMSKNEKIITLVLNIVSFFLFILVAVPFGRLQIANGEVLFKCLIAPIMIAIIFVINSYFKYVAGGVAYKYNSFSAYLSIFGYPISLLTYIAIIMLRAGSGAVYDAGHWILGLFCSALGASLIAILAIFMHKIVMRLKAKENLILDIALFILMLILVVFMRPIIVKHVGVEMNTNFFLYVFLPIILTGGVIAILVFMMYSYFVHNDRYTLSSRKELLAKWNESRERVYAEARDDILFSLYLYTKERLGIYDDLDICECEECECEHDECKCEECECEHDECKCEECECEEAEHEMEVAPDAASPVGAVLVDSSVNEENEKRLNELLKEKEELTVVEEPKVEEKVEVQPKDIKPAFNELVRLAKSLKDVTYDGDSEGTNFRFRYNKKVFLILNDTPKDYRLTFLMDTKEAAVYSQLLSFAKAKSPKGEYYYKLVNKGEFEPEQLFTIIRNGHDMVDVIMERERLAKEALKEQKKAERLQAKIDAMTKEEREAYYAKLEKKRLAEEKKKQKMMEAEAESK